MKIDEKMQDPGADVYYSKEFRDTLEAHMAWLRVQDGGQIDDVEPQKADVYDGDLFGYLIFLKINPRYHWVVMRANNMFSPTEFGPGVTSLLIPKLSLIETLRQAQKSTGTGTIDF